MALARPLEGSQFNIGSGTNARRGGANQIVQALANRTTPNVNITSTPAAPSGAMQGTPLTRSAPTPFATPSPTDITGGLAGGGQFPTGGFRASSTFERGPGTPGDFVDQMDPFLTDTIKARARGEGIGPTFEEVLRGSFDPQAELLDERLTQERAASIEDLVSRGVLTGSAAAKSLNELTRKTELDKRALFGKLALDFNDRQQRAIGEALGQLNILEGNKLDSRTRITTTNIQATATVRAASIQAGATVAAAAIGAKARLQAAGMNARVALAQLQHEQEMTAFELGVDLSDPQSVQDYYDYRQDQNAQKQWLWDQIAQDVMGRRQQGEESGLLPIAGGL